MHKRVRAISFSITILCLLFVSCSQQEEQGLQLRTVDDLGDKRFGVMVGSVYDEFVKTNYPQATAVMLDYMPDIIVAIENEKCDGALFADDVIPNILNLHPTIAVLDTGVSKIDSLGFGFHHNNPALRLQFNEFLQELREKGELKRIFEGWKNDFYNMPIPEVGGDGSGGVIRYATTGVDVPSSAVRDGKPAGYDIDIFFRFATKHNLKVEMQKTPFGGLIAALTSGKVDVIGSSILITDERRKQVAFSTPYATKRVDVLALKKNIANNPSDNKQLLHSVEDVKDKKIGLLIGSVYEQYVATHFPDAETVYIDTAPDVVVAVENAKCDVALMSHDMIQGIMRENPRIGVLKEHIIVDEIGFGFHHNNPELRAEFNAFLKELKASGILDELLDEWAADFTTREMPKLTGDGSGGTIRFGTTGTATPCSAIRDGKLAGSDIEILYRFANHTNRKVEESKIVFAGLIAALSSGKVDVIASNIIINEERSKLVAFSDGYAKKGVDLFALKNRIAAYADANDDSNKKKGLWESTKEGFENNILKEKRYLLLWNGFKVTLLISLLSALVGTLLGGLICFLRMSRHRVNQLIAKGYISLLRGTPILVFLMLLYYVVFAKINMGAIAVAVLAFSMNFAAYVSEMFRTAIQGVDRGQTEAGIALGFTKVKTFIHIVLPQALLRVMPVYKGEFISLVKMTSIVGYIAVEDLTKAGDIIRSRTFDAFFPLILVAIIYFALAWAMTLLLDRVAYKLEPENKNN